MNNKILKAFPEEALALVRPHLTLIDLPLHRDLTRPGEPIEFVFFIESGLASLLAISKEDRVEVGLIGPEGLVGIPALLGVTSSPFHAFMQAAGAGWRIPVPILVHAMKNDAVLRAVLMLTVHERLVQVSQTALTNGRHTVEQRLARWLLMAHDRLGGDDVPMTHEFLALMLGVRRPGVTVALHMLEGAGAIRARRGLILILDRERLKTVAGNAYGVGEALREAAFPVMPLEAVAAPAV